MPHEVSGVIREITTDKARLKHTWVCARPRVQDNNMTKTHQKTNFER